jgi:hypothetical protein
MPLAVSPPAVPQPREAVYGVGRIDASGRVADRSVIEALGWSCGDRLTITASDGFVVARRDPHGMVILPARAYLSIPSVLRRRCGLRPRRHGFAARLPRPGRDRRLPDSSRGPRAARARASFRRRRSHAMSNATVTDSGAAQQAAIEAALLVLEKMGLSPPT